MTIDDKNEMIVLLLNQLTRRRSRSDDELWVTHGSRVTNALPRMGFIDQQDLEVRLGIPDRRNRRWRHPSGRETVSSNMADMGRGKPGNIYI